MTKKMTGMTWLRARMEELGYNSLQQVAEDMDVNRGNLWRWFNLQTSPSVAMVPVFAEVLHVTNDEVLKALEVI